MGMLCPKGVPFSGQRYGKGFPIFQNLVCERVRGLGLSIPV